MEIILVSASWYCVYALNEIEHIWGFSGGAGGKDPACQCNRHERCWFNPWVRKIPWRRAWQPAPVFLPGEFPWTEEPGRPQSKGSQRVRHYWSDLAHTHSAHKALSTLSDVLNSHKCYLGYSMLLKLSTYAICVLYVIVLFLHLKLPSL